MIKLFDEQALATVAQSVEQLIRNQQVAGSSPASSSKKYGWFLPTVFFCYPFFFTDLNLYKKLFA